MVGVMILFMLAGTGVLTWWLVVGRTQGLKKEWNERVVSQGSKMGATVVPATGFFSFPALKFPGPAVSLAHVFNSVPLESKIAPNYRHLNTNDWMTIVRAEYPTRSGVEFSAAFGDNIEGPNKVSLGEECDKKMIVSGEATDQIRTAFTPKARELLLRSGSQFSLVSGGAYVTIYAHGVVSDPKLIQDMAEAAGEIAAAGTARV